ncbi:glycoside hydrolase TIM-barrel-like domain-containing protein [Dinoroseobacter sp. PD6]|nr:glycoside hydrolase TIM-barrel-like domain-containing protein [Dinoroseobacter sp. PD6]MDD9716586.1 glycoside hydrolase TIM-barrel-like domain-containing protein [Dinoroseobacter sp. PD6]
MATIVLSAAGAAIGTSLGGAAFGLSATVIGRAIGATIGRAVDQRLMGAGSAAVETGRIDRFRISNASEGDVIPMVFGKMRVAGQVIWASRFKETSSSSGGGKGAPARPKVTSFTYTVSLAIALCEGEIQSVGRVWADGVEISQSDLNLRVYYGAQDQAPDPKIEAVEGAGSVPAFRGTAYVVIEDLDLGQYGNRVPQFSFEVFRPAQPEGGAPPLASRIPGVAMIPGTGEYALATTPVHWTSGPGANTSININTPGAETDFDVSLQSLQRDLPNCNSALLVVSWFGNDLRCGECELRPKVDQKRYEGVQMPYRVGSFARDDLMEVPRVDGKQIYGGTPCDRSVIEAISALKDAGKSVVFYPFILMEQLAGNDLPNPYSGQPGQPVLPWRGRITSSLAPGQDGSPDGTADAETEVARFFGNASASDIPISGNSVSWNSGVDWKYRHFILHYARLCAAAGGVDAFCIGSEMRALTQIRGADNSFPAVEALRDLARDVRAILGDETKIGYAADWSEYFGYHPQDGSGDVFFHLDPLWADEAIDFIGIDNYMPLSDWRDGLDHADGDAGSIYNAAYLRDGVAGGEGYDWFYASESDRRAQIRTPIEDGLAGEPWVFRYKDLVGWWSNHHHDRINGERQAQHSPWVPGSKPIWFTEVGCAAVDKATNQPNKFVDIRSSESALPWFSDGRRDDLIQQAYYDATLGYWTDPDNNPSSDLYEGRMLDTERIHAWAWDARPWPYFPNNGVLWADSPNYARGHWIGGRITAQSLAEVVREICLRAGVTEVDVSELAGLVRGYVVDNISSARASLQPLMLAHGFEAVERNGTLVFRSRRQERATEVDPDLFAVDSDLEGVLQLTRAPNAELSGRVQLRYIEEGGDYATRSAEALFPDETSNIVSQSSFPISLTYSEGKAIVERWLAESRVARETARFALPPSRSDIKAGETLQLPNGSGGSALFRVDRIEEGLQRSIDAVRVSDTVYTASDAVEELPPVKPFSPPVPVFPVFLDLPLITGDEVPHAPHLAVTARPWPGSVAVYSSAEDAGYELEKFVGSPATLGVTETDLPRARPGIWDLGAPLRVRLTSGQFNSVDTEAVLRGANLVAIGSGSASSWELFQFQTAELVAADTFELSNRLRGQLGTETDMADIWPTGSYVVLINGAVEQVNLASQAVGLPRHYRIGPAQRPIDDPTFIHVSEAFSGIGLRPYAPVHVTARYSADGVRVSFVRRARIDGDRWDLEEIPLGESTERYLVRVRALDETLLREVTVTQTVWDYTAEMYAEDGAPAGAIFEVAQISDRFGPGSFGRTIFYG